MGFRIRIKVKHLLYMIILLLTLVCFILPNGLFMYASAMEGSDAEASKVCYKAYADLFSFGGRGAEALYKIAEEIVPRDGIDTRYTISPTGYNSGGKMITKDMINNAEGYYLSIMDKYKDSEYYVKAYGSLMRLYIMSGMFQEGRSLIDQGITSGNKDIMFVSSKYEMLYLIISEEYDKAVEKGNGYAVNGTADFDIYMLLGDASFFKGSYADALGFFNKARSIGKDKNSKYDMMYDNDASPYDRIQLVERAVNQYKGNGSIHGRVTINGEPAPYVYIYLKDGSFNAMGDERNYIAAVTDFDGEYTISKVPQGNFMLSVGVPSVYLEGTVFMTPDEGYFHLENGEEKEYNFTFNPPMKMVKPSGVVSPKGGKVDMEWESVDGAAYYLIRIISFADPSKIEGTYMSTSPSDKIYDTKFTIDTDKVNMGSQSLMTDDKGKINPQAYLGPFYPGSMVPVYVEAFDRSGRRITGSAPLKANAKDIAMVSIPGDGLTQGDRLLLQKKTEDAVKWYEDELQKNPDDIHSMSVLFKLYSIGISRKYEAGIGKTVEGMNIKRAEELRKRLYDLTKDPYYLKALLSTDYIEPEGYQKALEQYMSIPEAYLDQKDFTEIAEMNLYLKNYGEADKYFEKIYDILKDTNYYNLEPVLLKSYLGDIDGSMRFLDILDLRLYSIDKDNIKEDIKNLSSIDKSSAEYEKFKEAIILLLSHKTNRGYKEQFVDIYDSITEPALKDILGQFGNYYYVFVM